MKLKMKAVYRPLVQEAWCPGFQDRNVLCQYSTDRARRISSRAQSQANNSPGGQFHGARGHGKGLPDARCPHCMDHCTVSEPSDPIYWLCWSLSLLKAYRSSSYRLALATKHASQQKFSPSWRRASSVASSLLFHSIQNLPEIDPYSRNGGPEKRRWEWEQAAVRRRRGDTATGTGNGAFEF
ncbi:hypothetical protein SEVIR_2G398901v4 [Setaria viridis]